MSKKSTQELKKLLEKTLREVYEESPPNPDPSGPEKWSTKEQRDEWAARRISGALLQFTRKSIRDELAAAAKRTDKELADYIIPLVRHILSETHD